MTAGRPAKPISVLKLEGSYREDRHGGKSLAAADGDLPGKPPELVGRASEVWDYVASTRAAWIAKSDGLALQHLCDMWVLREQALLRLAENPTDKESRCALKDWSALWVQMASRFGLTPSDRARLGEILDEAGEDAASEFVQ